MRVKLPDNGPAADALSEPQRVQHLRCATRSLPIRLQPIPGEALESWIAALAVRMNATWGELLDAMLPTDAGGCAVTRRGAVLTTGVSDEEKQTMSQASGVSAAQLESMTLRGRYGHLIVTDRRTGRARTPWGLVFRQRFCPHCLKENPGRRKLDWFLPWVFVCVEHRCFLVDSCPKCAQKQVVTDWFARRLYPHPDRCDRLVRVSTPPRRCRARLASAHPEKLRAGHPVLAMQRCLTELLDEQSIDSGVYRVCPVTPEQLLVDVHILGNWIVRRPNLTGLIELFGRSATDHEVSLWHRRLQVPANPDGADGGQVNIARVERINLTAPAPWVGAGVTAALSVLMQPSLDEAGRALRAAMPSVATRQVIYRPRASGVAHSSAVTAVDLKARSAGFNVLQQLRYRTITDLPRLPDTGRFAGADSMLCSVPTLFWPEWALRLNTDMLAWNTARQVMSRLLLTIGCTMAEQNLRRHLRSTVDIERVAQAGDDIRRHPQGAAVFTALVRLHDYLADHRSPIDYQRRRRLDYRRLLPVAQWTALVAEEGLRTTPATATAARLWLTEKLSGAPIPSKVQHNRGVSSDRMRMQLTPRLVVNLDRVCREYLQRQGIHDEPPTWVPPVALLNGLSLPGAPAERIEPHRVHELVAAYRDIPAVASVLNVSEWAVRHQLEKHPMPSTVRRTRYPGKNKGGRAAVTARDRVAALLSESTLRDLCEDQGLSCKQIAAQLDTPGTVASLAMVVSALADDYKIRRRRFREADPRANPSTRPSHRTRTPPDPRVVRLYRALSIEPDRIPRPMMRKAAWARFQRFIAITEHHNFASAAQALGCDSSHVGAFIGKLEVDLGHVLVERADRYGRPMTLTGFGNRVLRAAAQIDRL